jgi:hypothetical protein
MFNIGDLLYILHWDQSGPMYGVPAALVIDRYEAIPRAYFNDDERASARMLGREKQVVYDILLGGEIEDSISESWLQSMADVGYGPAD